MKTVDPDLRFEKPLWEQGFFYIAGIDEAGRGAWAGPVYAGAAVLPVDPEIVSRLPNVRDSKMLSAHQRAEAEELIKANALTWGVGSADNEEIDRLGIAPATRLAMQRAVAELSPAAQYLLIDYVRLPEVNLPQTSMKKGDQISLSIAAASILAKTARDRWMMENAAAAYPAYGFDKHKGYGVKQHREAIAELGPCPIHRMSFRPFVEDLRLFP